MSGTQFNQPVDMDGNKITGLADGVAADDAATVGQISGGGSPTGSAGGALDGTYPNPGIAASVAGNGLSESSNVLAVNVDGSTIEISSDSLRVKADGITANEIAAGAVGASELAATAVTAGTYGDATHSPQIAIDADGRITSASDVVITGGGGGTMASGKVALTSGSLTVTSTSFVDATGLTVTITTGAHRCLVTFSAVVRNSSAGVDTCLDLAIDGTRVGQTNGLVWFNMPASLSHNAAFSFMTDALTAASHTFKIQWRVSAGTGTLFATTATTPAVLSVVELAT